MVARKRSYFAPVAANSHRTPAAAAGTRIVVEEKTAIRVGAMPKARTGSFGDNLCPRASQCGEQPVEAAFPRNEFDFPDAGITHKLIMPLGDAQDFVYRLNPL